MTTIDSVATFNAKMRSLGLADLKEVFVGNGWTTISSFAFATPANFAGTPVDEATFRACILTPLFGDATDPRTPSIRRLHFECYSQTIAEIHRKASRLDEDDKPKALSPPERLARLEDVKEKVGTCMDIEGELEPSDILVDKYVHMQESTGVLKYIPFDEVGRRDQEILGVKKDSSLKPDPHTGTVRVHEYSIDNPADMSTDYKFFRTLQRRGIALHMAHLLSVDVNERYVKWLFKELQRSPVPNHMRVQMSQILDVDREIFIRLAEETRGGLQPDSITDDFVLDALLPRIMLEPRILAFLNPRQLGGGGNREKQEPAGRKRGADDENDRLKEDNKRLRQQLQNKKKGGGGGGNQRGGVNDRAAGSGGQGHQNLAPGKKTKARTLLPRDLIGLNPMPGGFSACYDYNLSKGCSRSVDKNHTCDKGRHACMRCGSTDHGAMSSRCPSR